MKPYSSVSGVVTRVHEDGDAYVMIDTTDSPGIVGAPHVKVCRHHGRSANMSIAARNVAQAKVGDCVVVRHAASGIRQKVITFLGPPVSGLLLGIIAGIIFFSRAYDNPDILLLFGGVGLGLGIVLSIFLYRRVASGDDFVPAIVSVTGSTISQAKTTSGSEGCGGCAGCLPSHESL